MDGGSSLSYHVFKDYDVVFDEKGSKYGTIRLVQWVKEGNEPNEEKAKIEIRHMISTPDGEKFSKGYAFDTPEGPDELVSAMVECGFGETKEILRKLARREDFKESVENINKDDDILDGMMFDMRDLMNFADEMESEEDAA